MKNTILLALLLFSEEVLRNKSRVVCSPNLMFLDCVCIADPEREQRVAVAAHEDGALRGGRLRAEQHALRPHLQRHHRRRHRRRAAHQQGQSKAAQ